MKTVYKVLDTKNDKGQWYDTYEVPDDFPEIYGFAPVPPPEDMYYPKWDYGVMAWQEDHISLVANLQAENKELKSRLEMNEGAILEIASTILSR